MSRKTLITSLICVAISAPASAQNSDLDRMLRTPPPAAAPSTYRNIERGINSFKNNAPVYIGPLKNPDRTYRPPRPRVDGRQDGGVQGGVKWRW